MCNICVNSYACTALLSSTSTTTTTTSVPEKAATAPPPWDRHTQTQRDTHRDPNNCAPAAWRVQAHLVKRLALQPQARVSLSSLSGRFSHRAEAACEAAGASLGAGATEHYSGAATSRAAMSDTASVVRSSVRSSGAMRGTELNTDMVQKTYRFSPTLAPISPHGLHCILFIRRRRPP